jgi:hypothetical protein
MTGAADFKFLHHLAQIRIRNFKSKRGTANIGLRVVPWFPRFFSEAGVTAPELRKPDAMTT